MNKYRILYIYFFIFGAFCMHVFEQIAYVKKEMIVHIDNGSVSFKSNCNHNGDTYKIFIDSALVSKGIVVNKQWTKN